MVHTKITIIEMFVLSIVLPKTEFVWTIALSHRKPIATDTMQWAFIPNITSHRREKPDTPNWHARNPINLLYRSTWCVASFVVPDAIRRWRRLSRHNLPVTYINPNFNPATYVSVSLLYVNECSCGNINMKSPGKLIECHQHRILLRRRSVGIQRKQTSGGTPFGLLVWTDEHR